MAGVCQVFVSLLSLYHSYISGTIDVIVEKEDSDQNTANYFDILHYHLLIKRVQRKCTLMQFATWMES